jgi:hypothetical protein
MDSQGADAKLVMRKTIAASGRVKSYPSGEPLQDLELALTFYVVDQAQPAGPQGALGVFNIRNMRCL